MPRSSTTRKPGDPALPGAGRKPVAPEVKKALAELTPAAIENLREFLASDDKQERMFATKEVLDRNLGKAVQPTDNKHSVEGEVPGIAVTFVGAGK